MVSSVADLTPPLHAVTDQDLVLEAAGGFAAAAGNNWYSELAGFPAVSGTSTPRMYA